MFKLTSNGSNFRRLIGFYFFHYYAANRTKVRFEKAIGHVWIPQDRKSVNKLENRAQLKGSLVVHGGCNRLINAKSNEREAGLRKMHHGNNLEKR